MNWNDERSVNDIGTWMSAGGSFAAALSQIQYGLEAQKAAKFQADQMRINAGQAQAGAQRDAWSIQREAEYTASRALAVAAASGGGASDPTVVNLMARNADEMAYRRQLALYEGDEAARGMRMGAAAKEYSGANARRAANEAAVGSVYGAGSSLLKGYAKDLSLRERFGKRSPRSYGDDGDF